MSVERFRSIEAMNAATARAPQSDQDAFDQFVRQCARFWRLAPRTYPRGVFRFRSLEDAQRARQAVSRRIPS